MKPRPKASPRRFDPATIHLLKQLGRGLLTVTICALLVSVLWYVTRLTAFTIDAVSAEGGITIPQSEVIRRAEEVLNGSYIRLIPRRFTYFYPETEVVKKISEIPRIKNVQVERVSLKQIAVTYDEYVPEALWCEAGETKRCLFLDEGGYAFGQAPDLKGGSFIRYYTPEMSPEIGKTPFSVDDYRMTKEFANRLAETGWYVRAVEIDSVRDAFLTLVGGGELKVTLNESVEKTIDHLTTIRTSEQFSHLEPGTFEYIDLRFGTKVFVNEIKAEVELVVSSSTEEALAQ